MKLYEIELEIAGPTAIWTRPDTGDSPGTFPAPTRSAARGIFEAILWNPSVEIIPTKVEICAPLVYHHYTTNYGGPLRKSGQIKNDNNYQFFATVLINVHYRLFAQIQLTNQAPHSEKIARWLERTRSPAHAFQEIFMRRLKRGQCYSVPSLGWREFVPSYVGPFRSGIQVQESVNLTMASMLDQVFPKGPYSVYEPKFFQNAEIRNGVLIYGGKHAE
jgi:CRISPR-associated protein Cas5d